MSLVDDTKKRSQEILKDPVQLKKIQDRAREKGISFNAARSEILNEK